MKPYFALTIGTSCATSVASGTVVFYGVNSANDTNPDPAGINIGILGGFRAVDSTSGVESIFKLSGDFDFFSDGTSNINMLGGSNNAGEYATLIDGNPYSGSSLGDQNYANISFDGDDDIYEAVAQFNFDGIGGGYLVAIAWNDDGTDLSIIDGKAMIDNAVPEPSGLALLALGSVGLVARRRRRVA